MHEVNLAMLLTIENKIYIFDCIAGNFQEMELNYEKMV